MQSRATIVWLILGFAGAWGNVPKHANPKDMKITGGFRPNAGDYKYQVSIQSGGEHQCGGSIISERWVLTSASCLEGIGSSYNNWLVYSGTVDTEVPFGVRSVNRTEYHPEHTMYTFADLAVIQVKADFQWNSYTGPISMASSPIKPFLGGTVTGWGATYYGGPSSRYLGANSMPIYNLDQCKADLEEENHLLPVDKFCAGSATDGSVSVCGSDAGGPFVVDSFLVGVVSPPIYCTLNARPSVFTDVGYHIEWIRSVTGIV